LHGDSGSGKTLLAEVLVNQLGVDLIRVYLSSAVNKYIGATEKSPGRFFDLADTFSQRFTFIVRLFYPDTALRKIMWQTAWLPGIQIADDVDYEQQCFSGLVVDD
jgi:ATP-dependent 26S proteasome regulatory subunit